MASRGAKVAYGEMQLAGEQQWSSYSFDYADVEKLWQHLNLYEEECKSLLAKWQNIAEGGRDYAEILEKQGKTFSYSQILRFPTLAAYELALKCSHVFNLLDARGAISVTERVGVMARIRTLVVGVAKIYVEQGFLVNQSASGVGV